MKRFLHRKISHAIDHLNNYFKDGSDYDIRLAQCSLMKALEDDRESRRDTDKKEDDGNDKPNTPRD